MGSVALVVLLPDCDLGAGVGQCREQNLVQELVPEPPVEALDEPILHGLARRDVADARSVHRQHLA